MNQSLPPKKPKQLKFTPEERAKIEARKQREEASQIDPEWRLLAELGKAYGWQAIMEVREGRMDMETFNTLLKASRKLHAQEIVDIAHATFTAYAASQSKNPNKVMREGLKDFYKEAK